MVRTRIMKGLVLSLVLPVLLAHKPDENPDLFEGDIEMPPSDGFRSGLVDRTRLWPNGVIPYQFSEKSFFDAEQKANITAAMEEFHKHTCVRWVPRTDEEVYIRIQNGNGCSSNVGRLRIVSVKITQRIVLGWGCMNKGIIMHEMMHTAGFFHEQSRFDRDQYVDIQEGNIRQGVMDQFRIHKLEDQYKTLGPYDYGSLMHYRKDTFSEDGKDTIIPRKEGIAIGQREGFSPIDIYKINKLYRCPGYQEAKLPEDAYEVPPAGEETSNYPLEQKTEFGCTFDQKWACDMHDEMSSDLDWKIRGGASSRSGDTGPSNDAFYSDCCYIHIHTVGHQPGESSRLVGPYLKPNTPSCLNFYYHMYGASIGTLRVYIRDYRGEKGPVVFELSGQQSKFWKRTAVPIEYHRPFQLVFEATVGDSPMTSYAGDIAIDSVRYRPYVECT